MLDGLKGNLNAFLVRRIDGATSALTEYRARLARTDAGAIAGEPDQPDLMVANIGLLVRLRWGVHLLVPALLLLLAQEGLQITSSRAPGAETTMDYIRTLWPNFAIAAIGLAINGVYKVLLERRHNLRPIAHAQVWLDTAIFALVIYNTGGITSPFTFLYTIPILAGSMLLSFRASFAVAAFSVALLGAQAWLQFKHLLPTEKSFAPLAHLLGNETYLLAIVTLNGVLYLLIAVVSGVLTRQIHEQELKLRKRANEATMLHEVSATLQDRTQLDQILGHIMDTLVRRLGIDRALMYLVDDARKGLDLTVLSYHPRWANETKDDLKVNFPLSRDAGVTAICALEKKVFNVTDPLNHPLINREIAARIGLNAFAVAPMLARGRVVGVIGIDRKFQRGIITQDEAHTLAIAANQAGLTIQNARLYAKFDPAGAASGGVPAVPAALSGGAMVGEASVREVPRAPGLERLPGLGLGGDPTRPTPDPDATN